MKYTIKDHKSLSEAIKVLRKEQNISQEELSQFAGISRQTLSEIERTKADLQISTLLKILKLLGCKLTIESTDQ